MNEATWQYVREHAEEDVRQLALAGCRLPDVDMAAALQQIAGWQTAQKKLPSWAARQDILYPPHLNMEQSSSEATAQYKAEVAWRVAGTSQQHPQCTLVDLTGGLGVDFSFMARGFRRAIYVERNEALCDLAHHNLPLLQLPHAEVVCADTESFIASPNREKELGTDAFFFIDPARRDVAGRRTYAISDCTPDVLALLPRLMALASTVMIKLSPMLDWHKAVADIEEATSGSLAGATKPCHVAEVHCVATEGECKELLLVVKRGRQEHPLRIACIEGEQRFYFEQEATTTAQAVSTTPPMPTEGMTLLVPGAATMKAGCFRALEEAFGTQQMASNSHLFLATNQPVSGHPPTHSIAEWPGRAFHILAVTGLNKREIAPLGVYRANVSVRNFPMTADELRRRLKLKDGGEVFVFATTLENKQRVLLWCSKLSTLH